MQRKGTRKPNNAIITTNSTNQAGQQEDVIIEDAIEVPKKQITTFREFYLNIFSGIKILFIFSYYLHGLQPFQSKSKKMNIYQSFKNC